MLIIYITSILENNLFHPSFQNYLCEVEEDIFLWVKKNSCVFDYIITLLIITSYFVHVRPCPFFLFRTSSWIFKISSLYILIFPFIVLIPSFILFCDCFFLFLWWILSVLFILSKCLNYKISFVWCCSCILGLIVVIIL